MNNQPNKQAIVYQTNSPAENESTDIHISVSSRLEAMTRSNKSVSTDDELIASLQNHRENRRARQVFEWEAARRNCELPQFLRGAA